MAGQYGVRPNTLNIYHLGNNPLHVEIVKQADSCPGITVLHDCCLQSLALSLFLENPEKFHWPTLMIHYYGEDVRNLVDACIDEPHLWEEFAEDNPLFEPFVENSHGVIVHSNYVFDKVRKRDNIPVMLLQLPYQSTETLPDKNYQVDTFKIVFCGHAGPNRRLREFVEAWALLPSPEKFELDLYGLMPNEKELLRFAKSRGVDRYINIKGFVSEKDLNSALSRAHLAINFRHPTMGETSASQLRLWDNCLPTLVTDVGWYSECPDNSVYKISPDNEIEAILTALKDFLKYPEKFKDMGMYGKKCLEENHKVEDYVDGVLSFSEQIMKSKFYKKTLEDGFLNKIEGLCETAESVDLFQPAISVACNLVCGAK
jgi:glycosyltransferase involved in cell wall biosynthesis